MPDSIPPNPAPADLRQIVVTLFELGREVTSVLDIEELFQKIPQLISKLTRYTAFAVYLLDEKAGELEVAYSVGYPEAVIKNLRLEIGEGLVGAAVAEGRPLVVNDVRNDPR